MTDPKLLCQNYLKGKCTKGKACTYHHNGPCSFHKKGICNKGDKCVFSHHDSAVQPGMVGAGKPGDVGPNPKPRLNQRLKRRPTRKLEVEARRL